MIGQTFSTTMVGVDAVLVPVEAQITGTLKRFTMVGLPDGVLKESKERVRCAIEQSGLTFPTGDVVISLSPASLPKTGSGFDLAIALSILSASGVIASAQLERSIFLGELALDGTVKPVRGALAAACLAGREDRFGELILAPQNAREAAVVGGVTLRKVHSLLEAVAFLSGERQLEVVGRTTQSIAVPASFPNFGDVIGQQAAKRALEIVAAGGHNLLMIGPPGAGKSMLATRLPSILPPLSLEEQIEVTKIYSACAVTPGQGLDSNSHMSQPIISCRPYRAPHHTTSTAGLIGGGSSPFPGEISLAHKGVLFLDEVTEMKRDAIESLRQPLESRSVVISRAKLRVRFPADFVLVAAMNPCPCGKRGMPDGNCICPPWVVAKYLSKLSGPIFDRIDLQIWVPPVPIRELQGREIDDCTLALKESVLAARERQRRRSVDGSFVSSAQGSSVVPNAQLSPGQVKEVCELDSEGALLLERAAEKYRLSARAYNRVLKVARTIADLAGEERISRRHLSEAITYRTQLN